MKILAQLNGGPENGRLWALSEWFVNVPVLTSDCLEDLYASIQTGTALPCRIRAGRYEVRRDSFGQPVPASLEAYEFEWKGIE